MELTKKGTPRKRKPKTSNYYFTKDTEEAILEFVKTENQRDRDKLYKERIDYAFFKLSQNIINTYKFPYMDGTTEDKQQEVIFHLLKSLNKYDQSKGAAYSYFGTAALRYCIYENDKGYKKIKGEDNLDILDEDKSIIIDLINNPSKDEPFYEENYIVDKFLEYVEKYIERIFIKNDPKKSSKTIQQEYEDIKTCNAIIHLIKKSSNLDIFKKKAVLLYLREMTDQNTQQITRVSKKLEKIFKRLENQYYEYGFISFNF